MTTLAVLFVSLAAIAATVAVGVVIYVLVQTERSDF